jgi:hypothetical protein
MLPKSEFIALTQVRVTHLKNHLELQLAAFGRLRIVLGTQAMNGRA